MNVAKELMQFNYIISRNPIDMAEGGGVQDNSTRLGYLRTARKMIQPKEPTPPNKSAMTSHVGILFGGIPMFRSSGALAMDQSFYNGLLTIDNQPEVKEPGAFATSGTPKSETRF